MWFWFNKVGIRPDPPPPPPRWDKIPSKPKKKLYRLPLLANQVSRVAPVLPLGGLIVPKFGEIDNWGRPPKLDHSDVECSCSIDTRVYQKTLFSEKRISTTAHASAWGLV